MKLTISFFMILAFAALLQGQDRSSDLDLIQTDGYVYVEITQESRKRNDLKPIQYKGKSVFVKYNPLHLVLKGAMYTYQHVFSGQLASECIYDMSCSNYAKRSIEYFGLFKGVFMAYDRLLRCNRISALDNHPLKIHEINGYVMDVPADYSLKKR